MMRVASTVQYAVSKIDKIQFESNSQLVKLMSQLLQSAVSKIDKIQFESNSQHMMYTVNNFSYSCVKDR